MQPPRPRRRRERVPGARITYGVVLVLGALVLAGLLTRLALDLAGSPPDALARVVLRFTAPLVWPLASPLGVSAALGDLAAFLLLGFLWLLVLGVVHGWERESRRYGRLPHLDRVSVRRPAADP